MSQNGDIGYFSDILNPEKPQCAHRSLHEITKMYETMEGLQQKLHRLETVCQNEAQAVSMNRSSIC